MRINGGAPSAYPTSSVARTQGASEIQSARAETSHKVRVLKQALESQKGAADQLLKLLDPKGQNLDIRA